MTGPPPSSPRGFTLLEAIIALIILAGVIIVSVQSSAQAIAAERAVRTKLSAHAALEAIFMERDAGALGAPFTDPETGVQTWQGQYAGAPFVLERRPIDLAVPPGLARQIGERAPIRMWRTTLNWNGRTISTLEDH